MIQKILYNIIKISTNPLKDRLEACPKPVRSVSVRIYCLFFAMFLYRGRTGFIFPCSLYIFLYKDEIYLFFLYFKYPFAFQYVLTPQPPIISEYIRTDTLILDMSRVCQLIHNQPKL